MDKKIYIQLIFADLRPDSSDKCGVCGSVEADIPSWMNHLRVCEKCYFKYDVEFSKIKIQRQKYEQIKKRGR